MRTVVDILIINLFKKRKKEEIIIRNRHSNLAPNLQKQTTLPETIG